MSHPRICALLCAALCACSCAAADDGAQNEVGAVTGAVIYGDDDRVEAEDIDDDKLRAIATSAVVAIIPRTLLRFDGKIVKLKAPSLSESDNVCSDERFADQPAAAACTGVLLDDRTVLTAGHCMRRLPCAEIAFVFGYQLEHGRIPKQFDASDVYGCDEVLVRQLSLPDSADRTDFAWVHLDRDAKSHALPIVLRRASRPLVAGEDVTVVGFGQGLPMKVGVGGQVADARPDTSDFFITSSDTFHGDSGAPVFDAKRRLIGVQVRGNDDYVASETEACNVLAHLPDDAASAGEQNTHIARALDALCEDLPDSALCCTGSQCHAAPDRASGCSAMPAPSAHAHVAWVLWTSALSAAYARIRRRRPARALPQRRRQRGVVFFGQDAA